MKNTSDCPREKTRRKAQASTPLKGSPTIFRGYKTELDPTKTQIQTFMQCSGVARFVYNLALEARIVEYKGAGRSPSFYDQCKHFTQLKHHMLPWLKDVSNWVIRGALLDLERAFKNFFRRVKEGKGKPGFPRYKAKTRGIGRFRFFQCIRVDERRVRLPRIGWVRLKEQGYLPTKGVKVKQAAISERAGRWFVSLLVEEPHTVERATGPAIGVDLGVEKIAVCSDGRIFQNQKPIYRHQKKFARLQRELSRRQKGGKNRAKTKKKLARCHYRIACLRADVVHKATTAIVARTKPRDERPSRIVIEDLNIKGMMQNHHLARAIGDAGMREFRRQLEYKAAWYGSEVVVVDRFFPSSKLCSECGSLKHEMPLSQRLYVCEQCGMVMDRDENAARNLAACDSTASPAEIDACGEHVRPAVAPRPKAGSLRQEPKRASVGADAAGR